MKLTKEVIKQFENDQKDNGTLIALGNLQWQIAAEILYDTGVKRIKILYGKKTH